MITIDQLLESVDLDFEPRWVTKDENGDIYIWDDRPELDDYIWDAPLEIRSKGFGTIKLAEFENKHCQECIYEVPRKVDYTKWIGKLCWFSQIRGYNRHLGILKKISDSGLYVTDDAGLHYAHCEPVRPDDDVIYKDAVNELKGANQ